MRRASADSHARSADRSVDQGMRRASPPRILRALLATHSRACNVICICVGGTRGIIYVLCDRRRRHWSSAIHNPYRRNLLDINCGPTDEFVSQQTRKFQTLSFVLAISFFINFFSFYQLLRYKRKYRQFFWFFFVLVFFGTLLIRFASW